MKTVQRYKNYSYCKIVYQMFFKKNMPCITAGHTTYYENKQKYGLSVDRRVWQEFNADVWIVVE